MKACSALLLVLALAANALGQVNVQILSPTNGATVKGTIQVQASAMSTAAQITKVEFYRDGVLIGTAYHPGSPTNLRVFKLLFRQSRTNNVSNQIWI